MASPIIALDFASLYPRHRARQLLLVLLHGVLAYKRFRPQFLLWLERAQHRLGAYGPGGVARQRDLQAFVLALPDLAGPQSGSSAE